MDPAVSLPEDILADADQTARKLGISLGELVRDAVEAYVSAHRYDGVTEALDRVYAGEASEPSELDEPLARMQTASLPRETW